MNVHVTRIPYAPRGEECNGETLRRAPERTAEKRGSRHILTEYPEIMKEICESEQLRKLWEKYRREYDYAKDVSFDDACGSVPAVMNVIAPPV